MPFAKEGASARIREVSEVRRVLNLFRAYGHTDLDTARMYCGGLTEKMLAEVKLNSPEDMAAGLPRFTLATKAYPFKVGDHAPGPLRDSFNASLTALETNHVDIFYLHAPDAGTPFEETLRVVDEFHKAGRFTEFGLSNYTAWQVADMYHICVRNNWVLPTVYQGMYNPITRAVETELLPCLRHFGIRFYAYNPLAGGLLTGKWLRARTVEAAESGVDGVRFDSRTTEGVRYRQRYWNDAYFCAIQSIQEACEKEGVTLVDASLRWMMHHSKLDASAGDGVVLGASSYAQAEENLRAVACKQGLSASVVAAMDAAWETIRGACPPYFRLN